MVSLEEQEFFRKTTETIQIVLYICGIILHSLLLYAFVVDPLKCLKNLKMSFVINLAISDFLFCLISPFHVCIQMTTKSSSLQFLVILFASVSYLTIPSISVDRFLMVVYPIKHRCWMNGKVYAVWLSIIWFASAGISYSTKQMRFGVQQNKKELAYGSSYSALFLLTFIVYISVCFALKKHSRKITKQNDERGNRAEELRLLKEKKFMKTIIFIACFTLAGLLPAWILTYTVKNKILSAERLAYVILRLIFRFLQDINFSINPVIYVLCFPNFRKTFLILYRHRRWLI